MLYFISGMKETESTCCLEILKRFFKNMSYKDASDFHITIYDLCEINFSLLVQKLTQTVKSYNFK